MNNSLTAFALGNWRAAKLQSLQEYYDNLELFEDKEDERSTEKENKVSVEQKVEDISKSDLSKPKRKRSNNRGKTS